MKEATELSKIHLVSRPHVVFMCAFFGVVAESDKVRRWGRSSLRWDQRLFI